MPDLHHETALARRGIARIAGVDEVGRGPLAGPVVAAAVILPPDLDLPRLDDSKKLGRRRREGLAALIRAGAETGIGEADVAEIDRLNILQAALLAMARAVAALSAPPAHVLVDGRQVPPGLPCPATPIIGGDGRSLSIAAASVVAKVARDAAMVDLAQQHPAYGWDHNAGYPTPEHLLALKSHGASPHHRRSFRPVHHILCQGNSSSR